MKTRLTTMLMTALLVLAAAPMARGTTLSPVELSRAGTTTLTVTNAGGPDAAEVEVIGDFDGVRGTALLEPGQSVSFLATPDTTVGLAAAMITAACPRPEPFYGGAPGGFGICYASAPATTVEVTSSAGSVTDLAVTAGSPVAVPTAVEQ